MTSGSSQAQLRTEPAGPQVLVQQESIDGLAAEWKTLLQSSLAGVPFLTPTWLMTWWRNFGRGHDQLVLSFRQRSRLAGIAPLMRTGDTLSFFALSDVCDYHDFLFPSGSEEGFFAALMSKLLEFPNWKRLQLEGLRERSPALAFLPDVARTHNLSVTVTAEEASPHIPVAATWDDYLAALDK
ncbi:MAG: Acetyltransferase, partial [Dehalococcoidia bacterium]|nr:Acetyltransferase [Dehalococcoidia bacterium]